MPGGRPPKPSHLRIVGGNAGKRPLNEAEPARSEKMPEAPPHLAGVELETWTRLAGYLSRMKVLSEYEPDALEMAAKAYADSLRWRAVLATCGDTYEREGLIKGRPEVAWIAEAERRFMTILGRFGLTPSDRTKVAADLPGAKNLFDED